VERAVRATPVAIGLALALTGVSIAGHVHAATPGDPFEKFNRKNYELQARFNRYTIGPLTYLYRALTPGVIGKAIHNIVYNMKEPEAFLNDLLQLRPKRAGTTAVRFVLNTTIGIGGMIDVAVKAGLPYHPSSFGDTLGRYGVHPGPFLFLPMVGPSTVRDLAGNLVDDVLNPLHFVVYPERQAVSLSLAVAGGLDQYRNAEEGLRALLSNATDPYATLRSTYLQNREAEVSGQTAIPATLPNLDAPEPESSPAPSTELQNPAPSGSNQPTAVLQQPDRLNGQEADAQAQEEPEDCIGELLYAQAHWSHGGKAQLAELGYSGPGAGGQSRPSSCPVVTFADRTSGLAGPEVSRSTVQ
jgi:phospholipid-binding lipoprotein MlaA